MQSNLKTGKLGTLFQPSKKGVGANYFSKGNAADIFFVNSIFTQLKHTFKTARSETKLFGILDQLNTYKKGLQPASLELILITSLSTPFTLN